MNPKTSLKHAVRAVVFACAIAAPAFAADELNKGDATVTTTSDAQKAIARFKLAPGLTASLFAAEPHLQNPVAIATDEKGRWYVAETFRVHKGVTDIRNNMAWLDDDLACRTVEDRLAMHRKWMTPRAFADMSKHADRVKQVVDADGDGKADRSTIFSDGYSNPEDGIGSGLIARGGNVYFTNIPDLWLLQDKDDDGKAEVKRSLQRGYGVRVGFLGHDLHGLAWGPDGKLYFTVGDRGMNVKVPDGSLEYTEAGCVLRCNPDGSELEIFATGLRNPQELAFDRYGNLFTGDNNCDKGDPARWFYVMEGADHGWRVGYQHLPNGGPWNEEKIHATYDKSTSRSIVPPIAHVAAGPSGLAYYPGTGLSEKYDDTFLLVDFRGGTNSGIHSLKMKPNGAGFEMSDKHDFVWNVLAVDVEFGNDGSVYFCDWVNGWAMPDKGRIYKLTDAEAVKDPIVRQTRALIENGMAHRDVDALVRYLAHPDLRVRREAQYELAARGEPAVAALLKAARDGEDRLARIHAIWAIGQTLRRHRQGEPHPAAAEIAKLLADKEDEVRAQAARVLGDARHGSSWPALAERLTDPSPRVRSLAAIALGNIAHPAARPALIAALRENDDKDPFLRHAVVAGLAACNGSADLAALTKDPSPAVRIGAVLALRRLGEGPIEQYLNDPDPAVVLEAARAINDTGVLDAAMPALARLIDRPDLSKPLATRVLNAHFRLGQPDNARALAEYANRTGDTAALALLAEWPDPSGRDKVTGLWRPLEKRDRAAAVAALTPLQPQLTTHKSEWVRRATLKAMDQLAMNEPKLAFELATNPKNSPEVRASALKLLANANDPQLEPALKAALTEDQPALRKSAIALLARLPDASTRLETLLATGSPADRQDVLQALGDVNDPLVARILSNQLDLLLAGKLDPELHLDLIEAAGKSPSGAVAQKLKRFEEARKQDDDLRDYRETLAGGDKESGRKIFFDKAEVSCVRCHTAGNVNDTGLPLAGPDLANIASTRTREYLLESIVLPNKHVAPGFESVALEMKTKPRYVTGTIKQETPDELHLDVPDKGLVKVRKSDIAVREKGLSAMPDNLVNALTKRELRDLVEFLASLKTEAKAK